MKRSNTHENAVLRDESGRGYAVVLAGTYTAEHEWGVGRLQKRFGIEGGVGGFDAYTATRDASAEMIGGDLETTRRLGRRKLVDTGRFLSTDRDVKPAEHLQLQDPETPLTGAFDENDFAIAGFDDATADMVASIEEGVPMLDIAIWMGSSSNPFARGGLIIARPSLVPAMLIERFDAMQNDADALRRAGLDTGIAERVKAAKKGVRLGPSLMIPYLALTPVWTHEDRKGDTRHAVMFWLNPADKGEAFGYFTVEELDQWIEGGGPVLEGKG